jgi:hypothetical protein
MQRLVASALLTAGVLVLAGVGWALVVAGVFAWLADDRSVAWLSDRWDQAQAAWRRLAGAPRRSLAGGAMGVGLIALPAGATAEIGVAVGVMVFGGLLIGFSLLSGWGA